MLFRPIVWPLLLVIGSCYVVVSSAQMISPTAGTTWKVGQKADVKFRKGSPGETVNIFFNDDRSESLGGGPIDSGDTTFQITVPLRALSPPYGTSSLLGVHRINQNLSFVDNVPIHVIW